MEALAEFLPSGFVILVIASLVLITVGFLADSVSPSDESEDPSPPSRPASAALMLGCVVLLFYWVDNLIELIADEERDWFMLLVCLFWIGACLVEGFKQGRNAIFGAEDSQESRG